MQQPTTRPNQRLLMVWLMKSQSLIHAYISARVVVTNQTDEHVFVVLETVILIAETVHEIR